MKNIEDHIKRAMEEGKFDDLPGKGKPLNLDDNPLADPDWRLAHHVLKTGGFALPWIEMRQELEKEIQSARSKLARAWEWKQGLPASHWQEAEDEWQRALKTFGDSLREINKKIRNYNLGVPADRFQLLLLNAEREINRLVTDSRPAQDQPPD